MKTVKITLLLLFISFSVFSQSGMVFQGIARDNNSAAITDKLMTFTFRITESNGTDLFKETQQIRTDNFGVFSHVIGTGNAVTNTFNSVNFDVPNLKAIISVDNDGVNTEIYDQAFSYTAYAKHAQNGVPIGTVIAFMGDLDKIPDGWTLVDGKSLADAKYSNLKTVMGNAANLPDMRGEFLKGAGGTIDATNIDAVDVRQRQIQSVGYHKHNVKGNTNNDGNHTHTIKHLKYGTAIPAQAYYRAWSANYWQYGIGAQLGNATRYQDNVDYSNATAQNTGNNADAETEPLIEKWVSQRYSNHKHVIDFDSGNKIGTPGTDDNSRENRPDNIGVYWIIRYK